MNFLKLEMMMLRRFGLIYYTPRSKSDDIIQKNTIDDLQSSLFELGYVLSGNAYSMIGDLSERQGKEKFEMILKTLREHRGSEAIHVPLFRKFPDFIVKDSVEMWVKRVVAFIFSSPDQYCPVCGKLGHIHCLSPCGHWICTNCWDGANYSACPICQMTIDKDDPFLKPAPAKGHEDIGDYRVELIHVGRDLREEVGQYFTNLLSRKTPLSQDDKKDLYIILEEFGVKSLDYAPEDIPLKENLAAVYGWLLQEEVREPVLRSLEKRINTVTDILRMLCVYFDGEPDLLKIPKTRRSLSRPLRKGLLVLMEKQPLDNMIQDILRWSNFWLRFGEKLHPFDYVSLLPHVTTAFVVLRKTNTGDMKMLRVRQAIAPIVEQNEFLRMHGNEVRYTSWAFNVESAFIHKKVEEVIDLLQQRPGEMLRRSDQTLRLIFKANPELFSKYVDEFSKAAHSVNPKILVSLKSLLQSRTEPQKQRLFFPKGNVGKMFKVEDVLNPLSKEKIGYLTNILSRELLHRASETEKYEYSIVDSRLQNIIFPFSERSQSEAMFPIPRGSSIPVPMDHQFLRVFTHWTEPPDYGAVDLDMSVAFYDKEWKHLGECDYTQLSYPVTNTYGRDYSENLLGQKGDSNISKYGAIHSGDHQDAPPPNGSTEYIDLNLKLLRRDDIRYVVVIIFSYTDISFNELDDAFSGFMVRDDPKAELYDPRKVVQRFDLTSALKIAIPMMIDIEDGYMRWLDMGSPLTNASRRHNVYSYRDKLGPEIAAVLDDYFMSGIKMDLFELSLYHAVGRSKTVIISGDPKSPGFAYVRKEDEEIQEFFWRVKSLEGFDYVTDLVDAGNNINESSQPVFASLYDDDLILPDNSKVYILRRKVTDPSKVKLMAASDLIAEL